MDLATVGQVIAGVAGTVLVGASIRLWAKSLSKPRRTRKGGDDGSRWRPSIGSGVGYSAWLGGAGGSDSGGDGGAGGDGGDGGAC